MCPWVPQVRLMNLRKNAAKPFSIHKGKVRTLAVLDASEPLSLAPATMSFLCFCADSPAVLFLYLHALLGKPLLLCCVMHVPVDRLS